MTPPAHFLTGWLIASSVPAFNRRDYWTIVGAALICDLDGFGYPVEYLTQGTAHELTWYTTYHHVLLHGLMVIPIVALVAYLITRRTVVAGLAVLAFGSHLLLDLVGSGGPEGESWPLLLFFPFTRDEYGVAWQWPLNSPINTLYILALQIATIILAARRGFSPLSLFSHRFDALVFRVFRRTPRPASDRP